MKQIAQFSVGLVFGVLLMQYFNRKLMDDNNGSTRSKTTSPVTGKLRERAYPEDGQLPREDVSGGVDISAGLKNFLVDGHVDTGELIIDKVIDGVYVARGYSFVNVIMLEGQDGLVIVDTTESPGTAEVVLKKLREITKKPIKAIVLSHYHFDHVAGINVFIEDKENPPDIWAYHLLPEILSESMVSGPKAFRGAVHQFGMQLERDRLWPQLPHLMVPVPGPVPNKLIQDEIHHVEIAGLNLTFIHVPGEADDELAVWLPDKRVLLSADDIYKAFPNIYAIRGTPPRDPLVWAGSVQLMRDLGAEYLVPAHGPPVIGRQPIYDLLTAYSTAMVFVHDQTVRYMNEFRHPDEIGKLVRLPTALHEHPYLRQTYGTVEWTAKAVYQRYVGWFSGDPAELIPLTPSERSQALVDWLGVEKILEEVESALEGGRTQWALEMASHVHRVVPRNIHAKWLRLQALRQRAAEQLNPSARNYYLTSALDSYGHTNWNIDRTKLLKDVGQVMGLMRYRLKAELTDGINSTLILNFTDTDTVYRLQIVYSVLELDTLSKIDAEKLPEDVVKITTTEPIWLDILMGRLQGAAAYMSRQIVVDGSVVDARKFLSYF